MVSGLHRWSVGFILAWCAIFGLKESRGQEVTEIRTDSLAGWEMAMVARLSGSQAGYSNWARGGVNSLAVTSGLDWDLSARSASWQQTHNIRLAFGLVKQDTLDLRKAHDEIEHTSSLQYHGNGFFKHFTPTIALQTRTQFAEGLNYKRNPFEDGREPPVKVSDIMSPAIFTQTIGLTYEPTAWFVQRVGVAAKQTMVLIERFRLLYGVPPSRSVFIEIGVESRTRVDRTLAENVRLRSSLGLFAAFNSPDLPDLLWENRMTMKVNDWLSVDLNGDFLYDRDISRAVQIKEVFSLGISVVLL